MFDRFDIRYKVLIVWLVVFAAVWVTFQSIFPLNSMENQLNKIEESIAKKDWTQAVKYTTEFKESFSRNKLLIQMNNSTEALINFEYTIGQLEVTVRHKQESALEYVGALRETTNLVIKPFSGP